MKKGSDNEYLKKVLMIGPDICGFGGMEEVARIYRDEIFQPTSLTYICTNSRFGTFKGLFRWLNTLFALPFQRKKKEILHIHITTGKSFYRKLTIAAWGRILGYTVLLQWHGGRARSFFDKGINRTFLKFLGKIISSFIVLTQSWKEYFKNYLPEAKITVIPNPVRTFEKEPVTVPHKITFLFLGNIDSRKGIFDLTAALNNVKSHPNLFQLIICGKGEDSALNQVINKSGLNEIVDFRGWVGDSEKNEVFKRANVVVLPSYAEALPMCLLEGMAHRKALIGTDVGGIPEIIENLGNGILIEKGNIKELTDALLFYLDSPDKVKEHGEKSFDLCKKYMPEAVKTELVDLYKALLQKQ